MMLKSTLLSPLLVATGTLALGLGCSSGGTETTSTMKIDPSGNGGTMPGAAGTTTGETGGGGAGPSTGGAATTAGTSNGTAGASGASGMPGTSGAGGSAGAGGSGGAGGSAGAGGSGGAGPDPNTVVLYDGSAESFGNFIKRNGGGANPWKNNPDKTMTVQSGTGDIITKQTFQDVFLHVEYKTPMLPSDVGGQERGNSGVYLKSSYEMQVLDTYGKPPADDGCGALYGIKAPLVVACFQHEMWNTYEIEFKAQVCNDAGAKTANARFVKVTLNGQVVQENVDAPSQTEAGLPENCGPRGLLLQDHSSYLPVSFRNIWVIPRN
jgi:hypothetical protein